MSLHNTLAGIALACACTTLVACKSGYNRIYEDNNPEDEDSPGCNSAPINENIADKAQVVFELIADITCTVISDYTLVGQSLGNGNEIQDTGSAFRSYQSLVEDLVDSYGKRIAVISIDYEKSQQYDLDTLKDANLALEKHSDMGGIVSVTWTPINPWTASDNSVENQLAASDDTDITILYGDETSLEGNALAAFNEFDEQLGIVISALKDLDSKKVPVLFAPFPQMNTTEYWYGPTPPSEDESSDASASSVTTESEFKALWSHVADELAKENLTHLLWVYAPRTGLESERKTATWGYPGASEVDIVAGISYSNEVSILDYSSYTALDKPLGMTRLAPQKADGTFTNTNYIVELQGKYKHVAYWIADHDTQNNNADTLRSIKNNLSAKELLEDSRTATVETINEKEWLKEN